MIKIEKTYGVRGVANDKTIIRLEELISIYKQQCPIGKVIIDTEKITFYKFGLKMGIMRFASNGLVVDEEGIIKDYGLEMPIIRDKEVLRTLYTLFNRHYPFSN